MVVTQTWDNPPTWKIVITTVKRDGFAYICDVEVMGHNLISSTSEIEMLCESKAEDDVPVTRFSVKFTPREAFLELIDIGGACGTGGAIGGKWSKVTVKKGKTK